MKKIFISITIILFACFTLGSGNVMGSVLTFDDTGTTHGQPIPDGYV